MRLALLAFAKPLAVDGEPSILQTAVEALWPVAAFAILVPIAWLLFRRIWREIDVEAHEHQRKTLVAGEFDTRPLVLFVITAAVLTMQEYYGGRGFYDDHLKPWLREVEAAQALAPGGWGKYVHVRQYGELYSYGWWAFARVFGYIAVPLVTWKIIFPKDSLLDMGLRTRGFFGHIGIYLFFLLLVVPPVIIVSRSPEFGNYYPFYKQSSRSFVDLAVWEAMYMAQFFALEIFFRGFWLSGLRRSLGSGAIFAMCVPYCMIHYGKPYREAIGAVLAGIVLGTLAMRTRSIYGGFLVHICVALLMDFLALYHRGALPTVLWG